jgi:hypothetical protein
MTIFRVLPTSVAPLRIGSRIATDEYDFRSPPT